MERYCERSTNAETETGQRNADVWTDWSCDGTQIRVPLTLRDIQKPEVGKKNKINKDDLLPVSKDCLQQGKFKRRKRRLFRAADISFNNCSSFWTNRGSILRTLLTTGYSSPPFLFFYTLSLFLYALGLQPALPLSY